MNITTVTQAIARLITLGFMIACLPDGWYSVMVEDCELDRCDETTLISKANKA